MMDLEPIYCAEQVDLSNSTLCKAANARQMCRHADNVILYGLLQICVPPDLSEVLKAYTKEVIRRQPEDLVEFSAYYFANLANIAPEMHEVIPPTVPQISALWRAMSSVDALRTCDV